MQGVVRNLQILLEQSKLWKGELAQSLPEGCDGEDFAAVLPGALISS